MSHAPAAPRSGCLFLIPTPLGSADTPSLLPHEAARLRSIRHFVVEAEKTARAHLKHLVDAPIRDLHLATLNEHTRSTDIPALLTPLLEGHDVGLLSEAGCPGIADPGAALVALAHAHQIAVVPLIGPSSLVLALMASGANGQNFAFHGYLPVPAAERQGTLKALEREAIDLQRTQLFIETPYRNDSLLNDALSVLAPHTRLCVAADLTLPSQTICSHSIDAWKHLPQRPIFKKRPAVFVLWAA